MMEWTELDVDGRVTALRDGACAGVTTDGTGFVSMLADPGAGTTLVDEMWLDSFGVVGLSRGAASSLTGRGADGQMHLWSLPDPGGPAAVTVRSLEPLQAVWAAPALHASGGVVLAATVGDGAWSLRAHLLPPDAADASSPHGRALRLGGPPDQSLAFSFRDQGPITVAGTVGDNAEPSAAAWVLSADPEHRSPELADWRRVHLSPAPNELSSVATSVSGRRTWVAGRMAAKPVAYEVLSLPFRGLVRTTKLSLPVLTLSADASDGPARPVVLVECVEGDHPVFLAATADGNRLCWSTAGGTAWQACPAPEGRLHAACMAGGRIHALVDGSVWSLPDPTHG
jgi:hypothetical protein